MLFCRTTPNGPDVRVVRTGHPDEQHAQIPRRPIGIFVLFCAALQCLHSRWINKTKMNSDVEVCNLLTRCSDDAFWYDTSVALILYPALRPNHPLTQQDGDFLFLRLARCSRHSAVVVSRARFRCCVSASAYFFLLSIHELLIFIQSSSFMTSMMS